MFLKRYTILVLLIFVSLNVFSQKWDLSSSKEYLRITDCIIEDIDNDSIEEIIISSFSYDGKYVDVYKSINGSLKQIDSIKVPYYTVFFDVGDIDNNGRYDIVFLTSEGLQYREIVFDMSARPNILKNIKNVKSEIMVPQPELLTDVNMVVDLDGDGKNELIIQNIRAVEIYETNNFTQLASIKLKTVLEYALIPGQFYPHYIFYTLPIIQVKDLDNDKKMEIITKFPSSINIYGQKSLKNWEIKNRMYVGKDNVYFLSNAYVKFAFPVITDIDNDKIKEIVISSANLNLPRLKFEAIGDVYYFKKKEFAINKNKQIVVKGIPLNLPYFFNISDPKYKDFILPVIPFNIISVFGLLSGAGSIKVPFLYFKQDKDTIDTKRPDKLFDIEVRLENITSFVEELPLDQSAAGEFPDFYYFVHDFKEKTVDILHYYYNEDKEKYYSYAAKTISIPNYRSDLPATMKLGKFTDHKKKDVLYFTHKNLYLLTRK